MKTQVDWHRVPEYQWPMHERLQNWARYVRVRPHHGSAPMWRFTRTSQRMWHMPAPIPVTDERDGEALEHLIATLPEAYPRVLRWYYVYQDPPARIVRSLGVTYETLAFQIIEGRRLLIHHEITSCCAP